LMKIGVSEVAGGGVMHLLVKTCDNVRIKGWGALGSWGALWGGGVVPGGSGGEGVDVVEFS